VKKGMKNDQKSRGYWGKKKEENRNNTRQNEKQKKQCHYRKQIHNESGQSKIKNILKQK